jgi:hypothetical protein
MNRAAAPVEHDREQGGGEQRCGGAWERPPVQGQTCLDRSLGRFSKAEQVEERADLMAALSWVSHRMPPLDLVAVSSPHSLAPQEAGFNEVGHDPLDGALGDSDVLGHVAKTDVRVLRDAEQDLGVIRDERPAAGG